jgi:tetratricopeptide (TPR) repeat protein/predicted aspartyl protease
MPASTLPDGGQPPRAAHCAGQRTALRGCLFVLLTVLACGPASAAEPACRIAQWAQLQVTMRGTQPIVHALINGADATFIVDSGAFFNTMTPAAAAQFKLTRRMAPIGFYVEGVGGEAADADLATVREFTILGVKFPNVLFVVAGNDFGSVAGLLGQNFFRVADTEYDLANGAIRMMHPGECKSVGLAYWATSASYSQIDIEPMTDRQVHIMGDVYLNGKKIRAMFDTGASSSVISLEAAKSAGITPSSEGVVPAGDSFGVGEHLVHKWIAPFHSFKIGDEEIRNVRVHISDIGELGGTRTRAQMLLGADFFLSHRIYVAKGRSKLYFTYNGGPVFNLGIASKTAQSQEESIAVASGGSVAGAAQPLDAAAFSRRAMAATDRRDFASAVADLDEACKLSPDNPDYRYQRGMALWGTGQTDLALADFDEAIRLRPDDVAALVARARLRTPSDSARATADLEAADRVLPKEALMHLEIGGVYERLDLLPAALVQYSKWIDSHERTDVRMPQALNGRCWIRALLGQQLDNALADCNGALKLQSGKAAFLETRGLVNLRLGNYDKSIADYDAALAADPKIAWSHYGRGIARTRKGLTAQGEADIAAAVALDPKIADYAARHGIKP